MYDKTCSKDAGGNIDGVCRQIHGNNKSYGCMLTSFLFDTSCADGGAVRSEWLNGKGQDVVVDSSELTIVCLCIGDSYWFNVRRKGWLHRHLRMGVAYRVPASMLPTYVVPHTIPVAMQFYGV